MKTYSTRTIFVKPSAEVATKARTKPMQELSKDLKPAPPKYPKPLKVEPKQEPMQASLSEALHVWDPHLYLMRYSLIWAVG